MPDPARAIADAVLYEGHMLWPYRASSIKNRQRWTFGGVYPAAYARTTSDRSRAGCDCLVEGEEPQVEVEARFLHVVRRDEDGFAEATERVAGPGVVAIPAGAADGRSWERLDGRVELASEPLRPGLHRVSVAVENTSGWPGTERDEAMRRTLVSAHAVLRVEGGAFVSAVDPPEPLAAEAAACRSDGLWPFLVGEEGERSTMFASPIVVGDYARVAPESPGDFFDGGEIDQLLVLNILGLSDAEKREIRAGDPRAREILERTEAMTNDELARLHGTWR